MQKTAANRIGGWSKKGVREYQKQLKTQRTLGQHHKGLAHVPWVMVIPVLRVYGSRNRV